jgi:hypothetical protein
MVTPARPARMPPASPAASAFTAKPRRRISQPAIAAKTAWNSLRSGTRYPGAQTVRPVVAEEYRENGKQNQAAKPQQRRRGHAMPAPRDHFAQPHQGGQPRQRTQGRKDQRSRPRINQRSATWGSRLHLAAPQETWATRRYAFASAASADSATMSDRVLFTMAFSSAPRREPRTYPTSAGNHPERLPTH